MRESAVGMKCRSCARLPRAAVRGGSPRQYLVAGACGLAAAAALGAIFTVARTGLLGIVMPLLVGFLVGEVVSRTGSRRGGTGFQAIAGVVTVVGFLAGAAAVGVHPMAVVTSPALIGLLIAAAVAAFRVGR